MTIFKEYITSFMGVIAWTRLYAHVPRRFYWFSASPTARFASKSTSFPSSSSQLAQEPFILYRNQWMASSAPMPILSNGMECLQHRLFSGDVYTQLFNKMSSKGYPFEPYRRYQIDHIFWSTPPMTMILAPPESPWAPLSITSIIKAKHDVCFNRLNSRGVYRMPTTSPNWEPISAFKSKYNVHQKGYPWKLYTWLFIPV